MLGKIQSCIVQFGWSIEMWFQIEMYYKCKMYIRIGRFCMKKIVKCFIIDFYIDDFLLRLKCFGCIRLKKAYN